MVEMQLDDDQTLPLPFHTAAEDELEQQQNPIIDGGKESRKREEIQANGLGAVTSSPPAVYGP